MITERFTVADQDDLKQLEELEDELKRNKKPHKNESEEWITLQVIQMLRIDGSSASETVSGICCSGS